MQDDNLIDANLNETFIWEYDFASKTQRIANFIVDIIVIKLIAYGLYYSWAMVGAEPFEENAGPIDIVGVFIGWGIALAYYTITEGLTGKSIGKTLTSTRVITDDGRPLGFGRAFIRSLCRLIPFDAFSFLTGTGWHDAMSKTVVVRDR